MSHFVEESHKTYTANVDMVDGTIVKNVAGRITPATAATDVLLGTLNANIKAGFDTDVRLRSAAGTLSVKLGGTVALNDAVTSNATGLGVVATLAGNQILGYAQEPGVAGAFIEVLPSTAKF